MADHSIGPWAVERYRPYLHVLARQHMNARLRSKCDSSDLVQQTLLQAHMNLGQFRGFTEAELMAWLRQILANTFKNQVAAFGTRKRALIRERSLDDELQETSFRLENWLAADSSSPSEEADRNERLLQLAEALNSLPEDQRLAMELRHIRGTSITEICRQMSRTEASVAGLLRRGMKTLRSFMDKSTEGD